MAKLKKNRSKYWISGDKLMHAMASKGIKAKDLGTQARVSYQAILNYLSSTPLAARKAEFEKVAALAAVLEVGVEDLCFSADELEKRIDRFEIGFFGLDTEGNGPVDVQGRLDLAGDWTVTAELTGPSAADQPWSDTFKVEIRQIDARIGVWLISEAAAQDTTSCRPSRCRVTGNTLESGNFLAAQYTFDSKETRVYGFAFLSNWGDQLLGHFIGRNTRRGEVVLTGTLRAQRRTNGKTKPR